MSHYTAQIQYTGEWWIGWMREISGVNCQERTREELLESLRSALLDILEYDAQQAKHNGGDAFEVVDIAEHADRFLLT